MFRNHEYIANPCKVLPLSKKGENMMISAFGYIGDAIIAA